MIVFLSLLLVFWSGIETSDTYFGKSYLIFESEGARSIIQLQRSQHGNDGLKYLEVSIEHNVEDVPYQSIIGDDVLLPGIVYPIDLPKRTNELNFIVDFIEPCCKDNWVASIEYSYDDNILSVSYANCTQSIILYESINDVIINNDCYSSTLQWGSHCSIFCTCNSLPPNGKCPLPDSAPMNTCDELDQSFETCDYVFSNEMYFQWTFSTGIGKGTITSRILDSENAIAFNFINGGSTGMQFIFDHVFGTKIDASKEFKIPFGDSFVLTMQVMFNKFALRFDVSSQGEVSVLYKNCEQFKMTEKGICYGGSDNGMFYFCEENGNNFAQKAYKQCAFPNILKKYAEFKVFFTDYSSHSSSSTESDTLNMYQSSDSPGILHATYTREQHSSEIQVFVNGQTISGHFDVEAERDGNDVITIQLMDLTNKAIEGHVQIKFTEDGRILTIVDECTQFEIFSDQDKIECRAQFVSIAGIPSESFCFCNRNLAEISDCQPSKNPIVTECPTGTTSSTDNTEPSNSFLVHIFSGIQQATYKLSWEYQKGSGYYLFHKEIDSVAIDDAAEFHTLDVISGLIREWTFSVPLGDRITVSLPMGAGELFVMNFVPRESGLMLFYHNCLLGEISLTTPNQLPCIIESNAGWNFSICPGGAIGNPVQFHACSSPTKPQIFNYDLIADLNSPIIYVGSVRMDLGVYWNEERPDFFDFKINNYLSVGDVKLLINQVEYHYGQSTVFTIGNTIPLDFEVHSKVVFKIELNLDFPIVSVMANDCEQFKLNDNICRGERTVFHSVKFCATTDWAISHNLLTCSTGKTDPPIVIPSDHPIETHKMHFAYTKNSRKVAGFVTEEIKEDYGDILDRSIIFYWAVDTIDAPFPFSVSFTTMGKTISETIPANIYPIPFEVDSPISFDILDEYGLKLFSFSILVGEKSSTVIYEECDQFSVDEPEGDCYGTIDGYLCSGEGGDDKPLQPFINCHSSDAPPLTDLRAFYIYQSGQKMFIWDVMLSKDNDTGLWVVEASETGSTTMIGSVSRGVSAVSRSFSVANTLTFSISAGELTVFSIVDRQIGSIIDSFSILPSSQSITVIYNDCTQFTMGDEKDTVECYRLQDTRLCTGEPTNLTGKDLSMRACNVMKFSYGSDDDYGLVSQRTNEYQQELTIIPPKIWMNSLKISIDNVPSDSYNFILESLHLITITVAPQQSFSLLTLDDTTTVLSDSYCRQFEMDDMDSIDYCYSDGGVKLCPAHDYAYPIYFLTCTYNAITFSSFTFSTGRLSITHFTPSYSASSPKSYSLLTGFWDYSETDFKATIGDKKMNSSCYYALPPDGSAHFSFPLIPMDFSIELENGLKSRVLHEECFQFYMEDTKGECFQDMHTQLCEVGGGNTVYDYTECNNSPAPPLVHTSTEATTQPLLTTTNEITSTTEEAMLSTSSTVEEETTTELIVKTTVPTIATTIPTKATTHVTTLPPAKSYFASIVLEEVSIRIEKSVDASTKDDKIVFLIKADFSTKPDYKIYVDTIEYPYGTSCQEVHHNVGEVLNVTIASGTEEIMCVELEIHKTDCTVLELDDCPQFTLEENVNECRSSDLICLCASSASTCPIHKDPLETCKTSTLPSSSSSTPTTEVPSTTSIPSTKTTSSSKKSLDDLSNLANQTISIDNVSQVLEETNAIVEMGSQKMKGDHIYYVSQILFNSANVTGISQSDAQLVLDTLDDCLGAPEKSFKDSASNYDQAPQKFLQALPLLVVNSPSERLFLDGKQLGFSSQKHACNDEQDSSVFGFADTEDGFMDYTDVNPHEKPKSSIEIPIQAVCGSSGTHSFFSIHRTTKLFLGGKNYRRLSVKSSWMGSNDDEYVQSSQSIALSHSMLEVVDGGSTEEVTEEELLPEACSSQQSLLEDQPVMTATVLDASIDGEMRIVSRDEETGGKMATVIIDLSGSLRPLHGTLSFSWWDDSSLQWSNSDHCQLREGQSGGKVIADCYHLTDFTLIVDGTANDPCVCDTALIVVGYIIGSISICSLFLVVFATIINRVPSISRMKAFSFVREELFRNRFHSVDILYTISLLFFYLIFTLFHDSSIAGHACVGFAVISYSLLFCTVLLTLFQSFRTIATFSPFPIIRRILSFASHEIFVCTLSAGAPLLISCILAITSNFFDRDDGFCWVRPDYITFAVVVPLSVLIVNGIICTILVVIRLYQEQKSQLMTGKNHLKRRIISVLIMQFTLGMPWVLQYFTIYSPTTTVFHYLFTIVNGGQGIVLLLLYIYRRERRMTSMRRRRGAGIAARSVQARQMGAKHKSQDDDEYYDDDIDGKSTDGIVHK